MAAGAYKPAGHTSVAPYLMVDGAARTLAFLAKVFDAERLMLLEREDGGVRHAEVRIDDTVLMLADAMEGYPAAPAHVHVYVRDAQAIYDRAIDAGAEPVQSPTRGDDGDLRGGFRDSGGTTWWVGTAPGDAPRDA